MRRLLPVALVAAALVLLAAAPARPRSGPHARQGMTQVDRRERGAYGAAYRRCYRQTRSADVSASMLVRRATAMAAVLAPERERLAAARGCAAGQAAAQYALLHPPGRASPR